MGVVDMDTGQPLPPDVQSMSAYLGYDLSSMLGPLFFTLLYIHPSPL